MTAGFEQTPTEGKKVTRVLGATLAGVLAVGMVPAIAVADEPVATDDTEISVLASDADNAFENGSVTEAIDQTGAPVGVANYAPTYNKTSQYLIPTQITPQGQSAVDIFEIAQDYPDPDTGSYNLKDGFTISFYEGKSVAGGDLIASFTNSSSSTYDYMDIASGLAGEIIDKGDYTVAVTANTWKYSNATCAFTFSIGAGSLDGIYAYQGSMAAKNSWMYTGNVANIQFALEDNPVIGTLSSTNDYTVKWYKIVDGAPVGISTAPFYPGSYQAVVQGIGNFLPEKGADGQYPTVTVPFTITNLDLSKVVVTYPDQPYGSAQAPNADAVTNGAGAITPVPTLYSSLVNNPGAGLFTGQDLINSVDAWGGASTKIGPYTYNLYSNDDTSVNAYVNNQTSFSFNVVTTMLASETTGSTAATTNQFFYGDGPIDSTNSSVFKPLVGNPYCDIEYDSETNGAFDPSDISVFKNIANPDIDTAASADLLTSDQYQLVAIDVTNTDNPQVYNGDAAVSAIKNPGQYILSVKVIPGNTEWEYGGRSQSFLYTVEAPQADAYVSVNGKLQNTGYTVRIFSNGENLLNTKLGTVVYAGDTILREGSDYTVSYSVVNEDNIATPTNNITSPGTYLVTFTSNTYEFQNASYPYAYGAPTGKYTTTFAIVVLDDLDAYLDVPESAWYYNAVYTATGLHYMNGVGGNLFNPNGELNRAQAATVFYNMAGDPTGNFESPFIDVDSANDHEQWFYDQVAWASNAGIVAGVGDNMFDPYGTATRAQFAQMMYNYARATDQAGTIPTNAVATLSRFADFDQIPEWSYDAMAWAVENGIMSGVGNNILDPNSTVLRCQAASMAVALQPYGQLTHPLG